MLICAAGVIHGAVDRLYQDVFAFEVSLGVHFDCALPVGYFGGRPDPSRIDKATRHHDGAGDFGRSRILQSRWKVGLGVEYSVTHAHTFLPACARLGFLT